MASDTARRLRRAGINLALLLGSLIAALVVCELVARLLLPPAQTVAVERQDRPRLPDPGLFQPLDTRAEQNIDSALLFGGPYGVRLRPNTRAEIHHHILSNRDVVIRVNSIGLRYDELGPKEAGEFRVLVLGDSIVFGDFVPEEETFTRRMEADAAGRPKRIRFLNAGLPGAGTVEEYFLFQELKRAVQPDLVLVGMYLNDAQNGDQFFRKGLPYPYAHSRFLVFIADRFQLAETAFFRSRLPGSIEPGWRETFRAGRHLASGDMLHDRDAFDFEIYNAYMDFGLGWNAQAWGVIERILGSLDRAVLASGSRLAVLLFPVHIQIMGTIDDFRPQESCRRMCAKLGIPFFDPLPALRDNWRSRHVPLLYDHCHYRAPGYELIARDTVAWLDAEHLIPPRDVH